jgi:hypothetical protein
VLWAIPNGTSDELFFIGLSFNLATGRTRLLRPLITAEGLPFELDRGGMGIGNSVNRGIEGANGITWCFSWTFAALRLVKSLYWSFGGDEYILANIKNDFCKNRSTFSSNKLTISSLLASGNYVR